MDIEQKTNPEPSDVLRYVSLITEEMGNIGWKKLLSQIKERNPSWILSDKVSSLTTNQFAY
jgi:hypothetical protein